MLSTKVHVMLGTVEVNKVESWAKKQPRFVEVTTSLKFLQEVEDVYCILIDIASNKKLSKWDFQDLNNLNDFIALVTQNIAISFAEEVSKAIFLEKSYQEIENETVSAAYWITAQIVRTQKIMREKIEIKSIEQAQIEYRKSHSKHRIYEYGDSCDCYD